MNIGEKKMLTAAQARANADQALDYFEQKEFDNLMADIKSRSLAKYYIHFIPDNPWFKESVRERLRAVGYIVDKLNGNWRIRW